VIPENPLAEFEVASGALRGSRLTLFSNRLVHVAGESMETVPLAQLAAVGVAFERDPRKLNWAVALLVVALILGLASAPLQGMLGALAAGIKEHVGRESLDAVLLATLSVLGGFARAFVPFAVLLAGGAIALLAFFWLGHTTLRLYFAAVEREIAVRGRNPLMIQFAEVVAAQLASRKA
jgi:hypothetical protein